MADLIISQPMNFTVDVKNGLVERPQRESLMRGDKMANRIIAELVYGSEPFDITGVTVKGKFCRPPSGDEIDLTGEAKGNVAEVQLTDQCYTSGGHYEARVILVLGGVERTVLFISGDVLKSGSGNAAGDEETGGSGGSTGSGLPAGGTAGQVLVKVSGAQGDAIWKTLTAADVGAPGKNETAANANQLNGNSAEYYATAEQLNQATASSRTTLYSDYAKITVSKFGSVKQINIETVASYSPIPQNAYTDIGILPTEYRPSVEVKIKNFSYIPSSQEIAAFLLVLSPDGEVKIYNYSTITALALCINESYI